MSIEIGDGGLGYIYLGDVLIAGGGGEKPPFTPGANTIAYYKFDGNLNDSSGNSHNMTLYSGSLTYGTESGGGKYAYFNKVWTNYWERSFDYSGDNTISFWINYTSNGFCLEMWKRGTSFARIGANGSFDFISPSSVSGNITAGTWNLLTLTRSGTTVKCYANGVYIGGGTNSATGVNNTRFKIGNPGDANSSSYAGQYKLSELIWESKEWTATEIQDYYNQTKSNYGL